MYTARYRDMFARVERNNALSKYSTTFDIAQRYVFELAKVYDYDSLTVSGVEGLAKNPQVYLVPTGRDYMRTPAGTKRDVVSFNVVDQVLPLPYAIGSTELDDTDWMATLTGLDGTADSMAMIRRHAQFPANGDLETSQRLIGRSAWNDGWILVIPANAMNGNVETAKKCFLLGAVTDIQIGFKTNTR